MAIIHDNISGTTTAEGSSPYATMGADSPTVDVFGFDEISRPVLIKGSSDNLLRTFPLGAVHPLYENMYCTGPSGGVTSLPGTFTEGTISWKGFLFKARATSETLSISTRESGGPQYGTYKDALGEDTPYVYYLDTPYVPSKHNPKTGDFWKFRIIDRVRAINQQGVYIGKPTDPPFVPSPPTNIPPAATMPGTNGADQTIDWSTLMDPTINVNHGWVLRNFQTNSQFSVGDVALYFWTANWEYVDQYSPS